ncbi:MAG: DUF2505 family protein [Polyangia bacterium]|nr:DUF2505 family protein [Polyangia bacterium]
MAKQSVRTMSFPFPPDLIQQVLSSPEFQAENFKAQGNPDAKVFEKSRTDSRLLLVAEVTEYAKGVTGLDKSKTEQTVTTYDWDLLARRATWTYQSPHSQVKVWGAIRIDASGSGTSLTEEFNVEVKIPLLGGKIEKMVLKEAEAYWPRYEKLVADYCKKLG